MLLLLARPLGGFMARLIEGEPLPALRGVEAGVWRACGIRATEMNWWQYALAIPAFNLLGSALLFALLMTQGSLPLNPQGFPGLSRDLALNTAVSFVTNTNWQAYSGESALSYFSQMAGLAVQNFVSASTGIAVAFALIRAFTRRAGNTVGNARADLFRITLYVLLPIALLIALFFVSGARCKTSCLTCTSPRSKARSRRCRWGRSPRRKRSRCLAPTAAASSAPTRRTRSRTQPC